MEGTSSSVRAVWVISGKPERTCEEEGLFLSENRHLSNRLEEKAMPLFLHSHCYKK